ncbi:MAG TPA: 3-methyl-2-oxobutanoate hydroxymethyltransferase [Phycisphaerae bacterium]|nr:3-methyl-2-oxobutanoate hydroxymethyltransferase [Phycisphaerae bacterium]
MSTTPLDVSAAAGAGAGRGAPGERITLQTLREMKRRGEAISMLTAYDYPTARLLAEAGIEILLVGDSVATTVLGYDSTTRVTLEFLLTITDAVRRGAPSVFLMADMPFGSYPDVPTAVANAARFVREAEADAIKLEADARHAAIVAGLAAAGVVVCAHVGLLPQRAALQGGFKAQGRTAEEAARLVGDAVALADAGAQLLLIEAVPNEVTAEVQKRTSVPVLGCGAGPAADGHVVVTHDLLGFNAHPPRFAEAMGDAPAVIAAAAAGYRAAVRERRYPAPRHQYHMKR